MGVSKTILFTNEQNKFALMAKAFAHPARVAIIHHLLKTNACINNDLVQELGLAQATISQHLKALKAVGIIQGTIDGTAVSYCINPTKWEEIKTLFNELFNNYKPFCKTDCC